MEEKSELNDIILNKGDAGSSKKKILLAVATLGAVLIIVILLMSKLSPDANNNLPQAVPVPQKVDNVEDDFQDEPLFEDVTVIEEEPEEDLDAIAQRLKKESQEQKEIKSKTPQKKETKKVAKKHTYKPKVKKQPKKIVKHKYKKNTKTTFKGTKKYYVQVGSFSLYKPNKKFLDSITKRGYHYEFYKVGSLNKVLIGPFRNEKEARSALKTIKSKIERGAFLTRI